METVDEIKVITLREYVENERKRLLEAPNKPDFKKWLDGRKYPLDWMKKQFGETLTEKDGFINPNGSRVKLADCNVCGKNIVNPDEKIIHFDFSFCDEYSCDMNICTDCLNNLLKRLMT